VKFVERNFESKHSLEERREISVNSRGTWQTSSSTKELDAVSLAPLPLLEIDAQNFGLHFMALETARCLAERHQPDAAKSDRSVVITHMSSG